MTRHATTLLLSGCLALLGGCGDAAAPVTYVHYMTLHDEANSFLDMQRRIAKARAVPDRIECGLLSHDYNKVSILDGYGYVDGYSPRLAYYTFSGGDAERVKELPWHATVDDRWRNTFQDPFDCGPLPVEE